MIAAVIRASLRNRLLVIPGRADDGRLGLVGGAARAAGRVARSV